MDRRVLRLISYNLNEFRTTSGPDPARSRHAVAALRGDIVALQEFRAERRDGSALQSLGAWGRELGMTAVAGFTLQRGLGRYGSAVLTRLPVRAVRRHDVSVAGREPRGVLDVIVDCDGLPMRVLVTHLGLGWRERSVQIRRIAALLDTAPGRTTVLLGDLNDWTPGALQLRPLWSRLPRHSRSRTFPSARPLLALDRIATSSDLHWLRSGTELGETFRAVSDHLPIWAEAELG